MAQTLSLAEHIPLGLTAKERTQLLKLLINTIRQQNQSRIKKQVTPSGDRWTARRNKSSMAMMRKLRSNKHFKVRTSDTMAAAGYSGHTARIASIHHHGKRQQVGNRVIQYTSRPLIGVTSQDKNKLINITKQFVEDLDRA